MTKEQLIKDLHEKKLFTPDEVAELINIADSYPSEDTIRRVVMERVLIQHELGDDLSLNEIVSHIHERMNNDKTGKD